MTCEPVVAPTVIELAGYAALPVYQALDEPRTPREIGCSVLSPLEELVAQPDLPARLQAAVRSALVRARAIAAGDRRAYGDFLRAIRAILLETDLPVPRELLEDEEVNREARKDRTPTHLARARDRRLLVRAG